MKINMTLRFIRGVSLIELMIAITISAILLLGVGTIFSTSRRTYSVDEDFARLQENARVALKYLVEDFRMAGYVGCAKNFNLNFQNYLASTGDVNNDKFIKDVIMGIQGFEAQTSGPGTTVNLASPASGWLGGTVPPILTGVSAGSDIVITRRANSKSARLAQGKDNAFFLIEDGGSGVVNTGAAVCHVPTDFCEGDVLIATNCEKTRLFQVSNGMAQIGAAIKLNHDGTGVVPGNATTIWGGAVNDVNYMSPNDTEIMKINTYAYYVGTSVSGEPALFRQSPIPGVAAEELVEGVENLQVLYGIDTEKTGSNSGDGVANRYVTANNVNLADDNVVSVRLSILVRAKINIPGRPSTSSTYDVGGTNVTWTADQRLRKVFSTTVKVRNKGI